MPTVKEEQVEAYAHCPNSRCPGNTQQKVKAIKVTNEYSYVELGGDLPGVERSTESLKFADEKDRPCKLRRKNEDGKIVDLGCGWPRELSTSRRRRYPSQIQPNGTALDQRDLLNYSPDRFAPDYEPEYEIVMD